MSGLGIVKVSKILVCRNKSFTFPAVDSVEFFRTIKVEKLVFQLCLPPVKGEVFDKKFGAITFRLIEKASK